jgi:hypothetical protein
VLIQQLFFFATFWIALSLYLFSQALILGDKNAPTSVFIYPLLRKNVIDLETCTDAINVNTMTLSITTSSIINNIQHINCLAPIMCAESLVQSTSSKRH